MKIIRPFTVNDAALVSSNVTENDYAAYNASTTYALGARAIYVVANTHWVVESLQNANTGHTPTGLSTDTWWLKVSSTNRWKMFDNAVQSQTSNLNSIDTVLTVSDRINSVTLLNCSATTAQVIMTDAVDGQVFNQTYPLVSDSGITDWYAYFFEPIIRLQDLSITDMPPYAGATVEIILSESGETVLLGAAILGLQRNIGDTQYGANTGITDYSVKTQNDFGDYEILERAYRNRGEFTVFVDNGLIAQLQIFLASIRATPTVFIGSDSYTNTIIFGFYKDFNINIAYPSHSLVTMTIEGLT